MKPHPARRAHPGAAQRPPNSGGEGSNSFTQILGDVAESDTIETTELIESTEVDDEASFLSLFPKGTRYTSKSRLLARVRKASDAIAHELGGEAGTARQVAGRLGAFSDYKVSADILWPDSFNEGGSILIQFVGKAKLEAGLEFEPALPVTVGSDRAITMNVPTPGGQTFSEFKRRGWATEALGSGGKPAPGYSALTCPDTKTGELPLPQLPSVLAEIHARARTWQRPRSFSPAWASSFSGTKRDCVADLATALIWREFHQFAS